MCHPATCSRCGRTGWRGCGNHVDAVMASVPKEQRCTCDPQPARPGLLRSLFGGRSQR